VGLPGHRPAPAATRPRAERPGGRLCLPDTRAAPAEVVEKKHRSLTARAARAANATRAARAARAAHVGTSATTIVTGGRSGAGSVPRPGPSNAVVALTAVAAALLLIVVFGAAVRRMPPPAERAERATSAASKQPGEATNAMVPAIPEPAVTVAPDAPARSEPAPRPPLAEAEPPIPVDAPAATSVSLDGKRIGDVPVAPAVVSAGSGSSRFHAPPRTHASGEKRLLLP
jgi:hypothetical protein